MNAEIVEGFLIFIPFIVMLQKYKVRIEGKDF